MKKDAKYLLFPPHINQKSAEDTLWILAHEIGHYLGLSDEYKDDYSASLTHSTFSRKENYDSLMAAHGKFALACDDVDGFINVLDLSLSIKNNGNFTDRAKLWGSFCNGKKNGKGKYFKKEFYSQAKQLKKPDYIRDFCIYKFNDDGDVKSKKCIDPFNLYNREINYYEDGLVSSVKDKENNFEYRYAYNLQEGVMAAGIYDPRYRDSFFFYEIRKENNHYIWESTNEDDTSSVISIYEDGNINVLNNVKNGDGNKDNFIDFIFHPLDNLYGFVRIYRYVPKDNILSKFVPFQLDVSIDEDICTFHYYKENIPAVTVKYSSPDEIVFLHPAKMRDVERRNIKKEDFIDEVKKMCKTKPSQTDIEISASKARFFADLTSRYLEEKAE